MNDTPRTDAYTCGVAKWRGHAGLASLARQLERELSEERSKTDAYVAALGKVERELAEARALVGEAMPAVKGELIMGNAPAQAAWRNGWLERASEALGGKKWGGRV